MPTIKPTNPNHSGEGDYSPTIRPDSTGPIDSPDIPSKTIRPGHLDDMDVTPTIIPGRNRTILPGQAESGDTSSTILPERDRTINPGNTDGDDSHPTKAPHSPTSTSRIDTNMYQPRSAYTISGEDYRVIKPLSLTSGEAQVFLVEDSQKNKRVLKLYYKGSIPTASILEKVRSANNAHLLFKQYSHGPFEDRYYEILEYYEGDNLENIDVRQSEAHILPLIKSMAVSIDFCHQLGFIHRDIKPSNFIFDDKKRTTLLLGDFGIAVECNDKGECISDMARTKTFAAPEVYLNTGDGRARFSTKSDFYSLGMVIIFLWMGRDQFTHFEKENELQLATMKAYGNLPIPSNMPLRLFSLVKALIEPNPVSRAGFDEVTEWLKGGNPFASTTPEPSESSAKRPFRIVFSGAKNLIANSPEELANIMFQNQELAINYLYKGRITQWLEDNGLPEMAIEMERIKEDLYPRNTSAGLEAACYILAPSMPFEDICGNNCRTSTEIAKSILSNFGKYLSQLSANLDSRLLVFLQTHGLESVVMEFKKEFSDNKRLGLLYLAYRLDASLPWHMTADDGHEGTFNTCDEILNWVSKHNASDQSLSDVVSDAFMLWVGKRNTIAAAAIKPLMRYQGNVDYSEGVLYRLNVKTGLYYILDENSPQYVVSIDKIGQMINHCILAVINKTDPDGTANSILSELYDIQQGKTPSIYHFLKSKGAAYEKWIDWIKYCLEIRSVDNTKKAGPYGYLIALFKIAKGMSGKAFYTFKSGKTISNPSELSTVSASDLQDAKSNQLQPLEAWISVFYQEDPGLDKSTRYAYEKSTAEYMKFLVDHDFSSSETQRYEEAVETVETRAEKLRNTLSSIKKSRIYVALFALLPLGIAALLLAFLWRPDFGSLKFDTLFVPIAVILTIYLCFSDGFVGKIIGEAVWGCVLGAIVAWIISWLSRLASPLAPFVAAAMVAALTVYFFNRCFGADLKEKTNEDLLYPEFEHSELEPLHEAFHPNSKGFDSSIGDRTEAYQNELSQIKKTMWQRALPVGVITIISILYFLNIGSSLSFAEKKPSPTETVSGPDFSNGLYGTWTGTENDEPVRVVFEKMEEPNQFKMVMNKNNGSKTEITGNFDTSQGVLSDLNLSDLKKKGSQPIEGKLTLTKNKIEGEITISKKESIRNKIDLEYVPGT